MDNEGYPEDAELDEIRTWSHGDPMGLFSYLQCLWWDKDKGIKIRKAKSGLGNPIWRIELHTYGWSGNESLIEALEQNQMMQLLYWVESRRGGHYIYEVNQ